MAERRMFAKTIIDSDAFLDMPLTTQALYFHLSMRADDEGFINNPRKIQRMIGASGDDLKLLIAKAFLIPFDSGVVVIKHWKIHNCIKSDRFKETAYTEEKSLLKVKKNKAYTLADDECIQNGSKMVPERFQNGSKMETQVSIGKDSIGKDSIGKNIDGDSCESPAPPKPKKKRYGEYNHVLLTDDEYNRLCTEYGKRIADMAIKKVDEYCEQTGKHYKNYNLTIRKWGIKSVKESQPVGLHESGLDMYAELERKLNSDGAC